MKTHELNSTIKRVTCKPRSLLCMSEMRGERGKPDKIRTVKIRLHVHSHNRHNFIYYSACVARIAVCSAGIPLQLVDRNGWRAAWRGSVFLSGSYECPLPCNSLPGSQLCFFPNLLHLSAMKLPGHLQSASPPCALRSFSQQLCAAIFPGQSTGWVL